MFPTWSDWDFTYTSKGRAKRRIALLLRALGLVGALVGIARLRRSGFDVGAVKVLLQGYVRAALFTGAGILQTVGNRV